MHKRLFIPGPVDVREEVLQKMATPMISHRGKEATALQQSISEKLQKLMYTKNTIILSTSSGSGLMEGAIRSFTRKRAAVFSVGSFGDRWFDMAKANNVPADLFQSERGEPTTPEMVDEQLKSGKYDVVTVTHNETSSGIQNPVKAIGEVVRKYPDVLFLVDCVSSLGGVKIEVDAWGIDVCITSTQKSLGLPAGMAIASVSEKALEAAKQVQYRGFYFDYVKLADAVKKNFQYPSTPSIEHMYALEYQLTQILEVEGFDQRVARHAECADFTRQWAEKHFKLFAKVGFRSNTVTCIEHGGKVDVSALNKQLGEVGFLLGSGYGKFKDETFRVAHMAEVTKKDLEELFSHIEKFLGL